MQYITPLLSILLQVRPEKRRQLLSQQKLLCEQLLPEQLYLIPNTVGFVPKPYRAQ